MAEAALAELVREALGDATPESPDAAVALLEAALGGMRESFLFATPILEQLVSGAKPEDAEIGVEPLRRGDDGILVLNAAGVIQSANRAAEVTFGVPRGHLAGEAIASLLCSPSGETVQIEAGSLSLPPDTRGRRLDGSEFSVEISHSALGDEGVVLAIRDATAHGRAEALRRRNEVRFRTLIEQLPVITFMAALDEHLQEIYVSPQVEALLGFSQEEWLSSPVLWYWQTHPEDREKLHREFARGMSEGGPFRAEFRTITRSGEYVWIHGEAQFVRDADGRPLFIQGVGYDITEAKRAEEEIRASAARIEASLREKETLLKEIHHRVKNNLQVISSLLRLQSGRLTDPESKVVFDDSQNRVRTMALVHEKLYRSTDLGRVEFQDYVKGLITLLTRSYRQSAGVEVVYDMEESYLGIDVAVPLGLIVNELVSNCFKYAYDDGQKGKLTISLRPDDDEVLWLQIRDDGRGLPEDFDFDSTRTLGMTLIRTLADQIGGDVEVHRNAGTEFRIRVGRRR